MIISPLQRSQSAVLIFLLLATAVSQAESTKEVSARWDFIREKNEIKGKTVLSRSHKQLTVFSPRGDEYAQMVFSESPFVKIKKLQIKLKNVAPKKNESFGLKDLAKYCGFGNDFSVYQDICNYAFSVTAPKYPYTIEVYKEEEYVNLFHFRGIYIPTNASIASAVCSLVIPQITPVRHKSYALPLQVRESLTNQNRVITWSGENIERLDLDTLNELDHDWAGNIEIVVDDFDFIKSAYSGGTWADIGRWYAGLIRERYSWERIEPQVGRTQGIIDFRRNTYDNLVNDYRYVSISIGVGGWRPRLLEEITRTKYGDCKDLSMLLVNGLRENDVRTYPVLVLTADNEILDTTFPNFGFNHMIAVTISNNDTLWMDPTCRSCPLGQIPWQDENICALIVTDTAGVLVRTPKSEAADNCSVRHIEISLDNNRRLLARVEFNYTGQRSSLLRESFSHMTEEEQTHLVESFLGGKSASYKVKDFSIENLSDVYKAFRLLVTAESINPLKKVGQVLYLDPCVVEPEISVASEDYGRPRPIKFQYARTVVDSVRIVFDSVLTVDSVVLPISDNYSSKIGSWEISSARTDTDNSHEINLAIKNVLDETVVLPNQFEELKTFAGLVGSRDKRMIKVYLK